MFLFHEFQTSISFILQCSSFLIVGLNHSLRPSNEKCGVSLRGDNFVAFKVVPYTTGTVVCVAHLFSCLCGSSV
jgi:hypothetical protein